MGLFSSSKKNTTNVSETNTFGVQGDNSAPIISKVGGSVTIERVDPEIVADAINFAEVASDNAADSLDRVGETLRNGFETALNASKSSDERNTQSLFSLLNVGTISVAAVAGLIGWAWLSRK